MKARLEKPSMDDEMRKIKRDAINAIKRLGKEKEAPAAPEEHAPGDWTYLAKVRTRKGDTNA